MRSALSRTIHYAFFNLNKKPPTETKPIITTPTNKGYLAKRILDANLNKAKLLPPPTDPSKLTVVL
jgi:hypothetical protein